MKTSSMVVLGTMILLFMSLGLLLIGCSREQGVGSTGSNEPGSASGPLDKVQTGWRIEEVYSASWASWLYKGDDPWNDDKFAPRGKDKDKVFLLVTFQLIGPVAETPPLEIGNITVLHNSTHEFRPVGVSTNMDSKYEAVKGYWETIPEGQLKYEGNWVAGNELEGTLDLEREYPLILTYLDIGGYKTELYRKSPYFWGTAYLVPREYISPNNKWEIRIADSKAIAFIIEP